MEYSLLCATPFQRNLENSKLFIPWKTYLNNFEMCKLTLSTQKTTQLLLTVHGTDDVDRLSMGRFLCLLLIRLSLWKIEVWGRILFRNEDEIGFLLYWLPPPEAVADRGIARLLKHSCYCVEWPTVRIAILSKDHCRENCEWAFKIFLRGEKCYKRHFKVSFVCVCCF